MVLILVHINESVTLRLSCCHLYITVLLVMINYVKMLTKQNHCRHLDALKEFCVSR